MRTQKALGQSAGDVYSTALLDTHELASNQDALGMQPVAGAATPTADPQDNIDILDVAGSGITRFKGNSSNDMRFSLKSGNNWGYPGATILREDLFTLAHSYDQLGLLAADDIDALHFDARSNTSACASWYPAST